MYNLKEAWVVFRIIFVDIVNSITHQNSKCVCENLSPALATSKLSSSSADLQGAFLASHERFV